MKAEAKASDDFSSLGDEEQPPLSPGSLDYKNTKSALVLQEMQFPVMEGNDPPPVDYENTKSILILKEMVIPDNSERIPPPSAKHSISQSPKKSIHDIIKPPSKSKIQQPKVNGDFKAPLLDASHQDDLRPSKMHPFEQARGGDDIDDDDESEDRASKASKSSKAAKSAKKDDDAPRRSKQSAYSNNTWLSNVATTFESPEEAIAEGRFSVFGGTRGKDFAKQFRLKSVAQKLKKSGSSKEVDQQKSLVRESTEFVLHKPYFTYGMIGVNCLYFFITLCIAKFQFATFADNPSLGPTTDILLAVGAKLTALINNGQSWRIFTSISIHAGFVHLIVNMLMLKRVGSDIESFCGFLPTLGIYLMCGVSGQLASSVFNPNMVGVGASGAIYGFLGLLFGDFIQNHKTITEGKWTYFFSIFFSFLFGFTLGLLPIIDNWAHIGGFVMGLLLGVALLSNNVVQEGDESGAPWYSRYARVIAVVLIVLWMILMISLLATHKNGNDVCTWCRYLDCFNTAWWTCPLQ